MLMSDGPTESLLLSCEARIDLYMLQVLSVRSWFVQTSQYVNQTRIRSRASRD